MSLNGLDDVKVKEAHDFASNEPGGWFLLKYASRDEIELLSRGSGGIVELRNAIAQYEEESPLFGFLKYRRRNVLLRYVPEGCSRLIQARVTVHFNAVTERFSPHDTTFSITASNELRDSSLSAACSLHTASGSTSSSTSSIRKRMLLEIAEDEEEEQKKQPSDEVAAPVTESTSDTPQLPATSPPTADDDKMPTLVNTLNRSKTSASSSSEARPLSPTPSFMERRKSSQTVRPEMYSYKPKVKLGPRPSLDAGGRPHTAGGSYFRPVSTLPAGMKIFSKNGARKPSRPQSLHPSASFQPAIPETPDASEQDVIPPRPHTSGGTPSTVSSASPLMIPKTPTMTPEKARLMRALQLRKNQINAAKASNTGQSEKPNDRELNPKRQKRESVILEEPNDAGLSTNPPELGNAAVDNKDSTKRLSAVGSASHAANIESESTVTIETPLDIKCDTSSATKSDSTPPSPLGQSEKAESTLASSISESTDETLKEVSEAVATEDKQNHGLQPNEAKSDDTFTDVSQELEGEISINFQDNSYKRASEALEAQTAALDEDNAITKHPEEKFDVTESEVNEDSAGSFLKATPESPVNELKKSEDSFADEKIRHEPLQIEPEKNPSNTLEITDTEPELDFNSGRILSGDTSEALELKQHIDDQTIALTTEPFKEDTSQQVVVKEIEIEPEELPAQREDEKSLQFSVDQERLETSNEPFQSILNPQLTEETSKEAEQPTWNIPRSKFSVPNLKLPSGELPQVPSMSDQTIEAGTDELGIGSVVHRDSSISSASETGSIVKNRPRVDPIRTDVSATDQSSLHSDTLLSDDDVMDELQSATVQEAQPILVAKSPISSTFPSPQKPQTSKPLPRLPREEKSSTQPQRSVSASAYLNHINQQQANAPLAAKKVNIGSSISQRIKALERLSIAGPPSGSPAATNPSTNFFSVRKASVRVPSKSPSIAERTNSLTRRVPSPSPSPSPDFSRDSSPEASRLRNRSISAQNATEDSASNNANTVRGETISVTAKIVRDRKQPFAPKTDVSKDPTDFEPLDLRNSPLVIDHQKSITPPTATPAAPSTSIHSEKPPSETIRERRLSNASTKSNRRSSLTIIRDFVNDRRQSFSEQRRQSALEQGIADKRERVKSPSRPPSTHWSPRISRPMSVRSTRSNSSHDQPAISPLPPSTSSSANSASEEKTDKKSNRASRLLRRMSSSLSGSRKTIPHSLSPTVREESEPSGTPIFTPSVSQGSLTAQTYLEMGDVNVQFPDTLLWKRRWMRVDTQGFLIFAPAQGTGISSNTEKSTPMRRFHLSDFRPPYIPDLEVQELPNSVVLDFVDGAQLQLACEDRAGQRSVLNGLEDSYQAWVK